MISGFSIIRNGNKLGYPYLEALESLAPLVDELVVAVGDSNDGTRESIEATQEKLDTHLRIIDSPWDPSNIKGGLELGKQTNIALDECKNEICFYIQADEGIDPTEYGQIKKDLEDFKACPKAQALGFHWRHFYGNFDYTVHNRKWYRKECRVIKKSSGLRSYGDAQGFRISNGDNKWTKANAMLSEAHINHYGWVKTRTQMAKKTNALNTLWHGDAAKKVSEEDLIYVKQYGLSKYEGKLPELMSDKKAALEGFDPFVDQKILNKREYLSLFLNDQIEKLSGVRIGEYSNYNWL